MFLTWQLWKALRFPQRRHPIFNYARRQVQSKQSRSLLWRLLPILAFASVILFVLAFPIPTFITSLGLLVALPLLMMTFSGSFLGLFWTTRVSQMIASAQQDKRFDLMRITPNGAMGVLWLLCTGTIYRHDWLPRVYRIVRWVLVLVLVLLGLAIGMLLIGTFTSNREALQQQQLNVMRDVINISLIVIALWIDHIQSIVIAAVLGIVASSVLPYQARLQPFVPIIYLLIQLCSYLVIFLVFQLISILLIKFLQQTFITSIMTIALSILMFYFMREAIISFLLRMLFLRYSASVDDYQRAVHVQE